MIVFLSVIFISGIALCVFLQQPQFGKLPGKERQERYKGSFHYKNGKFVNLSKTPVFGSDAGVKDVIGDRLFNKNKDADPSIRIPSVKTNLLKLPLQDDVLVWLGHSSIYMQLDGKRILVDPVLSGSASPVSFVVKSYEGSQVYTADDIPDIDYLFITHDHFDHLDYETVIALKSRVGKIICGLGVGEHFEYWGFDRDKIIEKDWYESSLLGDGFTVYFTPARHFSGRSLNRNVTLWTSFVLQTPSLRIFISGDGGYDTHFAAIGEKFGTFDLAILENGQYDKKWPYIHLMPEEALQAARDLNAKRLLPVHSSKFTLANHAWNEPLNRITALNDSVYHFSLATPRIGEVVDLKDSTQTFTRWWTDVADL